MGMGRSSSWYGVASWVSHQSMSRSRIVSTCRGPPRFRVVHHRAGLSSRSEVDLCFVAEFMGDAAQIALRDEINVIVSVWFVGGGSLSDPGVEGWILRRIDERRPGRWLFIGRQRGRRFLVSNWGRLVAEKISQCDLVGHESDRSEWCTVDCKSWKWYQRRGMSMVSAGSISVKTWCEEKPPVDGVFDGAECDVEGKLIAEFESNGSIRREGFAELVEVLEAVQ
jgi:hypothetical protein